MFTEALMRNPATPIVDGPLDKLFPCGAVGRYSPATKSYPFRPVLANGPFLEYSYSGAVGCNAISMPGSCRPVRWQFALGKVEKEPERAVHRLGILEDFGNVGIEKHNVGAGLVVLVMLSPHSRGENRTPISYHLR